MQLLMLLLLLTTVRLLVLLRLSLLLLVLSLLSAWALCPEACSSPEAHADVHRILRYGVDTDKVKSLPRRPETP